MNKQTWLAIFLACTASFFWAANAIVGKMVVATLPAFTFSQFRWFLAFAILAPFGVRKIVEQIGWYKAHFWPLIGLSILSVTLYNTFQYWALEYTQPLNVGALLAMLPVFIAIVASLFGGVKQSAAQWSAISIAVLGALLVVTKGQWSLLNEAGAGVGEALLVIAMLSWSFYTVLLKKLAPEGISAVGMLSFFMGVGSLFILPFWAYDIVTAGTVIVPPKELWWAILFVAIFPSIVSYFCWMTAVKLSNATTAGLMMTTAPLFNALLSLWVLNLAVSTMQWVGIVIVIVGVAATLMMTRPAQSG